MTPEQPRRLFISYSTKDGSEKAAELRRDLERRGFTIWQDIVALRGDTYWWTQIEHALRSKDLQHFVLVVTPGALVSRYVKQEIRLARQEGKTVSPIRGPGIADMSGMPAWLGNLYDLKVRERHDLFLEVLKGPSTARRVPMMAPDPPEDFVRRPREFDALKRRLLDAQDGESDAVAITAALRGAGGYGKTTLAQALAHDPDVQDAYFDGVLWVELGEQGGARVLPLIADLVKLLTGEARDMATLDGARTALAEALGDRRILLVVDDVWKGHHLAPFLHGGRRTTRLVTTRFDPVLPASAARQVVDAMQTDEALDLIGQGLPRGQARSLRKMAFNLGEWPQLLKLANGFLRQRVDRGMTLDCAISDLAKRFDARGLVALDGSAGSVAKVIETSMEVLDETKRDRFAELGIFPEDVDVPIGIAARLWADTGGLDDSEAEDLLVELSNLSLLLSLTFGRRTLRLHDTTRHYLRHRAGPDLLAAQHCALIRSIGEVWTAAEANYVCRYLLHHVAEAGDRRKLDALLLDPGWLKAKLAATGSPQGLVADYEQYGEGRAQELIGQTLRLTSGICARDQRQLVPQLIGRLMAVPESSLDSFRAAARQQLDRPALLPDHATLMPPAAEIARLEEHAGWVTALAVLPDGGLASGSEDRTVRLWNRRSGSETALLEGHTGWVTALVALPDGCLASGSEDRTLRLWKRNSGAETARLERHAGPVRALAALPDGRLASGSDDATVCLWDPESRAEVARLERHTCPVRALAVPPNGRLASGSEDNTVRLWDPNSKAETARLEGHTRAVRALAALPDGRLASGSDDTTVRLWDPESGAETARLKGHTSRVTALAVLSDCRLASGSWDNTVRLWDPGTGEELCRLEVDGAVHCLAVLPARDGRALRLIAGDALGRLHWLEVLG